MSIPEQQTLRTWSRTDVISLLRKVGKEARRERKRTRTMDMNFKDLRPIDHALLHEIAGTIAAAKPDVPFGAPHKLGGLQVTFFMPDSAFVNRAEGTAGNGFDTVDPPKVSLSLNAALLLLRRANIDCPPELWAECIRADLKGDAAAPPDNAIAALAVVQAEQPEPEEPPTRRTQAKRIGEKEVRIEVKRIPAPKKTAKPKSQAA